MRESVFQNKGALYSGRFRSVAGKVSNRSFSISEMTAGLRAFIFLPFPQLLSVALFSNSKEHARGA
jgi:hypothetical protein